MSAFSLMRPDLDRLLTLYGRKPVLEALQDDALQVFRLHLADSNRSAPILQEITALARKRNVSIATHSKLELSRISKNSQQDQGIALDISMPNFMTLDNFLEEKKLQEKKPTSFQLIALDGVTNPQNLGMVIRSVCASPMTGLLLPSQGCAKIDALVIKASAGTVFRCPVIRCASLPEALQKLAAHGAEICLLDSRGETSLFAYGQNGACVFVLGNETEGVSASVASLRHRKLAIPMCHGVESLNVAVAAALVAFQRYC